MKEDLNIKLANFIYQLNNYKIFRDEDCNNKLNDLEEIKPDIIKLLKQDSTELFKNKYPDKNKSYFRNLMFMEQPQFKDEDKDNDKAKEFLLKSGKEGYYINHTIALLIFMITCVGQSMSSKLTEKYDYFDDTFKSSAQKLTKKGTICSVNKQDCQTDTKFMYEDMKAETILKSNCIWLQILFSFLYWNKETTQSIKYSTEKYIENRDNHKFMENYFSEMKQLYVDKKFIDLNKIDKDFFKNIKKYPKLTNFSVGVENLDLVEIGNFSKGKGNPSQTSSEQSYLTLSWNGTKLSCVIKDKSFCPVLNSKVFSMNYLKKVIGLEQRKRMSYLNGSDSDIAKIFDEKSTKKVLKNLQTTISPPNPKIYLFILHYFIFDCTNKDKSIYRFFYNNPIYLKSYQKLCDSTKTVYKTDKLFIANKCPSDLDDTEMLKQMSEDASNLRINTGFTLSMDNYDCAVQLLKPLEEVLTLSNDKDAVDIFLKLKVLGLNNYNFSDIFNKLNNIAPNDKDETNEQKVKNQIRRIKDGRMTATKMTMMHCITGQTKKCGMVETTLKMVDQIYNATKIDTGMDKKDE